MATEISLEMKSKMDANDITILALQGAYTELAIIKYNRQQLKGEKSLSLEDDETFMNIRTWYPFVKEITPEEALNHAIEIQKEIKEAEKGAERAKKKLTPHPPPVSSGSAPVSSGSLSAIPFPYKPNFKSKMNEEAAAAVGAVFDHALSHTATNMGKKSGGRKQSEEREENKERKPNVDAPKKAAKDALVPKKDAQENAESKSTNIR